MLFEADRLTIYVLTEDKGSIVSKVKTGLTSFKDIKLPINEQSIAGFVAVHKRVLNIRDVYDDAELKSYSPRLNFLKAVEQDRLSHAADARRAGARCALAGSDGRRAGHQFAARPALPADHGGRRRPARARRSRSFFSASGRRSCLCAASTKRWWRMPCSRPTSSSSRSARRGARICDLETVLVDEFQVKVPQLGDALAAYFNVPYEPFKPDRIRPGDLLRNMSREFCETNQWLPHRRGQRRGSSS